MDKLLKLINQLRKDLKGYWKTDLEDHGYWVHVKPLYDAYDNGTANVILAFTVLAYHKDSQLIEIHKDRLENTVDIMRHLVGEQVYDEPYCKIARLDKKVQVLKDLSQWVIDYQKDYRWNAILASYAYYAYTTYMLNNMSSEEEPRRVKEIGLCAEVGEVRKAQADKMLRQIQEDYMVVDTRKTAQSHCPSQLRGKSGPKEKTGNLIKTAIL